MSLKKRIMIGVFFVALIVALRFLRVEQYVNLTFIQKHFTLFEQFVHEHYLGSVLVFLASFIIVVILAIPITPLLNLLAGALFSFIPATIYCIMGATIGSTASFFLVRYAFGAALQKKYGHRLEHFNKEFKARGASYLLFLQLLPITPFAVIIVLSGLSAISWFTFLWTTALGIMPGTMIYVFAGRKLANISRPSDILSPGVIVALIALALISFMPIIMRFFKRTRKF